MHIVHVVFSVAQFAVAIGLIFIVMIQQTKSEGLGGVIGGKVTSTFKGKPGFEERLTAITTYLGVGFFVASIIVAVSANR